MTGEQEKNGCFSVFYVPFLTDIKAKKEHVKMEVVENPLEQQRTKRTQSSQH